MEKSHNRREYPRVESKFPIEITTAGGTPVAATALTISRAGLQVGCDEPTTNHLLPNGVFDDQGVPAELDVRLMLPFSSQSPEQLDAHCRVIYANHLPHGGYRIGLEYVTLDRANEERLEHYIEECMCYP